ncbi:ITA10 protein, partial [Polypterus senegalus]
MKQPHRVSSAVVENDPTPGSLDDEGVGVTLTCTCFNIDIKSPRIFNGPADALFGFKVLQHEADGQKWCLLLVKYQEFYYAMYIKSSQNGRFELSKGR